MPAEIRQGGTGFDHAIGHLDAGHYQATTRT
jgi:hypothetical protein